MNKNKEQIQKISAHVQFETVSPATKLLEERRKMYQVHQAFEVQKDQFKRHEENFKAKEDDIRKRDLEIQIHLINFCQYLQENDSKRKKAQERFKQDLEVFNKKEQEIERLQQQIAVAYQKQQKFDRKISSLRKYEQYLEKVRSTYSDQYPEMSDILSRYQTLKKFNQKLLKDRDVMEAEKESLKIQSSAFEKHMNQTVLQLSNQIKDISKKLENKSNIKRDLQSELERNRDMYERKNLDLAKMLMAIDNLYSKCNEGIVRIKHSHEEFAEETESKNKKVKKGDEKGKKKGQATEEKKEKAQEDISSNTQLKCKLATQKLKSIFAYTKDYRAIIEEYKKQMPASSVFRRL